MYYIFQVQIYQQQSLKRLKNQNVGILMLNKGTASLELKNSERNRKLENFASLEPRVCEVLLYLGKVEKVYDSFF